LLFALLTALANALAVMSQHMASTMSVAPEPWWRLVWRLVRHPLWLLGWLALGGSLLFQALALHFGTLSLVQPVLVIELVAALALRRWWLGQALAGAVPPHCDLDVAPASGE